MIKKTKKSKKSTTKQRNLQISPLIPIIAIIEVLVLIVVSTYAWYYIQASKIIGSGTISVAADSGLDIDFQYSNVDDYINIWNYVGSDFTFEPATSLDGRTIYFPTTGTFDNDETGSIVFRDGTVNDINSKYLSIDFELSNTSSYAQYVYLNNNSYFHVQDVNSSAYEESRALRLAFYQNDGNSGNVGSSLLNSGSSSDGGLLVNNSSPESFTIYFDNSEQNWSNPYAYFWDSDDGSNPEYKASWPGVKMDRVAGQTYSVTIENPPTAFTLTSDVTIDDSKTYYTLKTEDDKDYYNVVTEPDAAKLSTYYEPSGSIKYNKLKFSNNGSSELITMDLTMSSKNHKFTSTGGTACSDSGLYTEHTVYFAKPKNWDNVFCHTWHTGGDNNTHSYTSWPGDEMSYVGSGIYAYNYDGDNTGGILFDNGYNGDNNQTVDIQMSDHGGSLNDVLFYTNGDKTGGKYRVSSVSYSGLSYRTIYLLNSYNWANPYATVSYAANNSVTQCNIALTYLSGDVYYCTVPNTLYSYVYFYDRDHADNRTEQGGIVDNQVYRPKDIPDGGEYYPFDTFRYDKYIKSAGYPVISPGVSAGFQRPYSPVVTIDQYSGAATEIVPAYSNSIDNYILGAKTTPLFVLEPNHMASLSMIMWLEGTDEACTGTAYAGKQIDLRLEFSTKYTDSENQEQIVNPGDSNAYIYNFYDRTREIWTSDRQPTESGVTIAPVMQLYDNTAKRGYLMSPSLYASYNGKQKVRCWTVTAPQSIALNGHDIIFRRVNPYNEDEVWNYWHAGPVAGDGTTVVENKSLSVYSVALSSTNTTNDTINFTAFADGSPLNTLAGMEDDDDEDFSAPAQSCGGLWGDHAVRTVTVYDGLPGQPLEQNKGVLTIRYDYQYKVGNTDARVAQIEYKASGPEYHSFYYLMMPEVAYANNVECAIKRYTGFESAYAINSAEKNSGITFVDYYGKGQHVSGDYFELNQMTNGADYSYWGSDMLYLQTNAFTKNYCYTSSSGYDNNAKLLQVRFTANNFANENNDRFVFLYYNGNFSPENGSGGSGFACVVPNDKAFSKFRVENCSYNGDYKYNVSDGVTINGASDITFSDPYTGAVDENAYQMKVRYLDDNGFTLTSITARIFLQTTNCNYNTSPNYYCFSSANGKAANWPGLGVTWSADVGSMKKYYVDVEVSKFEKIIFAYWGGSSQSQEVSFDLNNIHNGDVYESQNTTTVTKVVTGTDNATLKMANEYRFSPDEWPHLTFQS